MVHFIHEQGRTARVVKIVFQQLQYKSLQNCILVQLKNQRFCKHKLCDCSFLENEEKGKTAAFGMSGPASHDAQLSVPLPSDRFRSVSSMNTPSDMCETFEELGTHVGTSIYLLEVIEDVSVYVMSVLMAVHLVHQLLTGTRINENGANNFAILIQIQCVSVFV